MAAKIYLSMMLVAIVGYECQPLDPQLSWGIGGRYKGNLNFGADGGAAASAGFRDGKLGARGGVNGKGSVDADGGLSTYAYVANGRPGSVRGLGLFSDLGYEAGASLAGQASANAGAGKGDSLLSALAGASGTKSLTPEAYGGVGGNAGLMKSEQLEAAINKYNGIISRHNSNNWGTTTVSYFKK